MLTKNYYVLDQCFRTGRTYSSSYVYDVNNSSRSPNSNYANYWGLLCNATEIYVGDISASTYGIRMGSGTRAPALTDINLESPIVKGLSIINRPSRDRVVFSDRVEYPVSFVVRNSTSKDITVSELGMFTRADNSNAGILLDRTVLDEPVVIPAGERRMITYTFVFNDPNM